jgi:hypothetical protein
LDFQDAASGHAACDLIDPSWMHAATLPKIEASRLIAPAQNPQTRMPAPLCVTRGSAELADCGPPALHWGKPCYVDLIPGCACECNPRILPFPTPADHVWASPPHPKSLSFSTEMRHMSVPVMLLLPVCTRTKHLTADLKPMVEVAGRPLIDHAPRHAIAPPIVVAPLPSRNLLRICTLWAYKRLLKF